MTPVPPIQLPTTVDGWDVEQAVIDTLQPRLGIYAERAGLAAPRGYIRVDEFDKWPEDQLPLIVIVSPGLVGDPIREGSGKHRAFWAIGVLTVFSARTELETRKGARRMGALARAVLLQEPSLHGFARGVKWMDETYDDVDIKKRRSISTVEQMFYVDVDNVVDARELPVIPDPDAPTPNPSGYEVTSTEIIAENRQITQEVNP